MSADKKLVERLRSLVALQIADDLQFIRAADGLMEEAASALEASEAEKAALTAENATLREKVERTAEDELDRLYILACLLKTEGALVDHSLWLAGQGAILPSDRAALRQEGKP